MSRHGAGVRPDDVDHLTRTQPAVTSLARGLRKIGAQGVVKPFEVVDWLTLNEAADMLVRLVDERDRARETAMRLEEELAHAGGDDAAE